VGVCLVGEVAVRSPQRGVNRAPARPVAGGKATAWDGGTLDKVEAYGAAAGEDPTGPRLPPKTVDMDRRKSTRGNHKEEG
jgi:hypothetical protein